MPKIVTKKTTPSSPQQSSLKTTHIYTDGSGDYSVYNDVHGGVGIFFGDDDIRNISMPYIIYPITHNRAEIYGMIRAVEIMTTPDRLPKEKERIIIYSDSQYAVNTITEWIHSWKKRKWKKSDGKEPENLDLWYWLDKLLMIYSSHYQVDFQWVPAHLKEPKDNTTVEYKLWYGNMMADKFAVAGREASKLLK